MEEEGRPCQESVEIRPSKRLGTERGTGGEREGDPLLSAAMPPAMGENSPLLGDSPHDRGGTDKQPSSPSSLMGKLLRQKSEADIAAELKEEERADANLGHTGEEGQRVNNGPASLKRTLNLFEVVCFGIGTTVGAGLFVTTGKAARDYAGPAVSLSFIVASLATLMSGLCYAELAARIPVSGSAYSYAYATLGEGVAWFIGWNLTLEYGVSASAIARAWSSYLVSFLKAAGLESIPLWIYDWNTGIPGLSTLSPLSAVIILLCTVVLLMGAEESSKFNVAITSANLLLIGFIVVVGSLSIDATNWEPFMPFGVKGVMSGAGFVFFSYIGFDAVCSLAEELKDPQRDLPRGVITSLAVVTALYVAVSVVITGMVPAAMLDTSAPLSIAFNQVGKHWAGTVVALGSTTTLAAATFCTLYGQPRIFFRMAKDGLLIDSFANLNPKTHAPSFGIIFTGIVAAVLAAILDLETLADMISIGTLLAFIVVCLGVLIIRKREMSSVEVRSGVKTTLFAVSMSVFTVAALLLNISLVSDWPLLVSAFFGLFNVLGIIGLYGTLPEKDSASGPHGNGSSSHRGVVGHRMFRCPWIPLVPCLGVFANFHLIASLPLAAVYRLIGWTFIGFVWYFCYGMWYSKLEKES